MLPPSAAPIVDGHMDMLYAMEREGRDFFVESERGQTDLPRLRRGGVAAALCAIFFELGIEGLTDDGPARTLQLADRLRGIVDRSEGAVRLVRSTADLDAALAAFQGGREGPVRRSRGLQLRQERVFTFSSPLAVALRRGVYRTMGAVPAMRRRVMEPVYFPGQCRGAAADPQPEDERRAA